MAVAGTLPGGWAGLVAMSVGVSSNVQNPPLGRSVQLTLDGSVFCEDGDIYSKVMGAMMLGAHAIMKFFSEEVNRELLHESGFGPYVSWVSDFGAVCDKVPGSSDKAARSGMWARICLRACLCRERQHSDAQCGPAKGAGNPKPGNFGIKLVSLALASAVGVTMAFGHPLRQAGDMLPMRLWVPPPRAKR